MFSTVCPGVLLAIKVGLTDLVSPGFSFFFFVSKHWIPSQQEHRNTILLILAWVPTTRLLHKEKRDPSFHTGIHMLKQAMSTPMWRNIVLMMLDILPVLNTMRSWGHKTFSFLHLTGSMQERNLGVCRSKRWQVQKEIKKMCRSS